MKTTLWKRLAAATLAVMMFASLTACGDSSSSQAAASSAAATEAPKTEETTTAPASAPQQEQTSVVEAPDSTADAPAAAEDLKTKWASLSGKTLRVGTTGVQKGWSQDDGNGGLEGMDIDVMNYICDYYGMSIEWTTSDSSGLWGMLQNDQLDTIAALTTVNEDRLDLYWFTNTYAWESYCIVSRNEDGIPEDGDLDFWDGKTIATPATGNPALILEDIIAQEAEKGITINSLLLDSSPLLVPAVAQKQADGALMCTSTCAYILAESGYTDTMHIQNIQWKNMPIVYGWPRKEENKDYIEAFNDLIAQMHEDGTLSELSQKWFGMDVTEVPEGEVNYVTTTGDNAWQSYEAE